MSATKAASLHHEITGPATAPALVLLDSLGMSTRSWDAVVRELENEFRIIRLDYRGHGLSRYAGETFDFDTMVADVLALLDTEGIDQAHVAGVSLGGMLTLALAARHPERVLTATPMCCGVWLPVDEWRRRAALVRAQGIQALVDIVTPRWFTDRARADRPDLVTAHIDDLLRCSADGYAAHSEILAAVDLREEITRITVPTLVVSAAEDKATPPQLQREITERVPGARLITVPDAAHLITAEASPVVAEILREHIAHPR